MGEKTSNTTLSHAFSRFRSLLFHSLFCILHADLIGFDLIFQLKTLYHVTGARMLEQYEQMPSGYVCMYGATGRLLDMTNNHGLTQYVAPY